MRKAFIQLHFAILLAGFTGILGRLITLREDWLVWYRMLIASVTLWILFFFMKKLVRISFHDLLRIFGVGAIVALHWLTFYGSIKYSTVSIALVCFSALGFFTAILEPLIFRKKFSASEILLGLMVIAGIYIIFHFDPKHKVGIVIGLISALLGGLFPILNRKLLEKHSAETVTLYEMSGGFLALSALMPLYALIVPQGKTIPSVTDLLWLLVLSWFCTVLAFQLLMNSLKKISAFTVNLSYNLEPLYGILLAFVVYRENEQLDRSFYIGLSIILLAVFIQTAKVYYVQKQGKKGELLL